MKQYYITNDGEEKIYDISWSQEFHKEYDKMREKWNDEYSRYYTDKNNIKPTLTQYDTFHYSTKSSIYLLYGYDYD